MRKKRDRALVGLVVALGGCSNGETPVDSVLPIAAPSTVSMVANAGFQAPTDAVVDPTGTAIYFSAQTMDDEPLAALFTVPSQGGAPTTLHAGAPLAFVSGLVMACDGSTLYAADMGGDPDAATPSEGGLYAIATGGGAPTLLAATGIATPSGLALADDCETLYITGWTDEGEPALFTLPRAGGTATIVHAGAPLVSPTGMYVDAQNVAWVLDHQAESPEGDGSLFAIPPTGIPSLVASGLRFGTPGGCSLTAGGGTAVIPTRDRMGKGQLTTIEIATGLVEEVAAPSISDPAGLRTARRAGVFAVVDSEGGAIFRAE